MFFFFFFFERVRHFIKRGSYSPDVLKYVNAFIGPISFCVCVEGGGEGEHSTFFSMVYIEGVMFELANDRVPNLSVTPPGLNGDGLHGETPYDLHCEKC